MRSAEPRPTHRRSPTSCSPGAVSDRPSVNRSPSPPPALPPRSTPYGRSSRCRRFRTGASAPAAEANVEGAKEMFDRTIEIGPASRRATKPRYLSHAGRPSPGIRREQGPRVHLLPRTVPWGARGHRHLRRRLRPGRGQGSLRRASLYHTAGRQRLDPRRTRQGNHRHRTEGQSVQDPDSHAERRGRGSKAGRRTGLDPGQEIRAARLRRSEVAHDTAIYRACRQEHQRLLEQGAAVLRVRLDTELKSTVARRSESARAKEGRRAADAERHRVARELGLPVDARGRVLYPDAQIEYTDADGRTGRVNIEVASGNYRAPSIRAKANAGFVLHANGPAAARMLRSLGVGGGNDRSSLRGPTDRDPAAIEL